MPQIHIKQTNLQNKTVRYVRINSQRITRTILWYMCVFCTKVCEWERNILTVSRTLKEVFGFFLGFLSLPNLFSRLVPQKYQKLEGKFGNWRKYIRTSLGSFGERRTFFSLCFKICCSKFPFSYFRFAPFHPGHFDRAHLRFVYSVRYCSIYVTT